MAKKSDEKFKKVKALVNIKYDESYFKIGDEFDIRSEDSEEMTKKGYVESLEKIEKGETKEGE
ncbi:Uncharacterised protein [Clostridium tetani]|uniref:DUF7210 domain-containing protein n=1 Tax=Clostridium tetani TaxID=1513 RepID=A0A4Q0VH76_CLOTA|nr:hypothetical protein [Clostridium tetani]AVP54528.1 hypothetical protein C3B72_05075 [Clostridium tetani]RXI50689.1 hypothetical protein DP130_01610 [Clostridium tetani]RXI75204.1 hypothetical protein DP128_11630 [Clostridium tetani]WFN62926.1 hypothetical protein PAA20_05615 [Clostridium tetani]SUY55134.1 Uncharacterised protein [Clostridium tetani]